MPSTTHQLATQQLLPGIPSWLADNSAIQYEVIGGSYSYGVSGDVSDMDIVGFAIPDKKMIFPHLAGHVEGFGTRPTTNFNTWQKHHVIDPKGNSVDLTIYSIVSYFELCRENNPNMIDSLFVPQRCIKHMTPVGQMVRDKRHLFLSKKVWHTFRGYADRQMHNIRTKRPEAGKRAELVEKFGFDIKYAYHILRLMDECEQILSLGDLNLERNREEMKACREGAFTLEEVESRAARWLETVQKAYQSSTLPVAPDESALRTLLLNCLEQHYGSLGAVVVPEDAGVQGLREIDRILGIYKLKGVL